LEYGSADAGETVHTSSPDLNTVMQYLAQMLHLAPHKVKDKVLFAAGDVEGHQGPDNRKYLLDLGRYMPPENPYEAEKKAGLNFSNQSIVYRFLRPDLLRQLPSDFHLISPDAFSGWGKIGRTILNKNCTEATTYLLDVVIPKLLEDLIAKYRSNRLDIHELAQNYVDMNPLIEPFMKKFLAKWISRSQQPSFDGSAFANHLYSETFDMWVAIKYQGINPQTRYVPSEAKRLYNTFAVDVDLTTQCHRVGVPMRLLGLLRSKMEFPELKLACLVEMLKRAMKNLFREKTRKPPGGVDTQSVLQKLLSTVRQEFAGEQFWSDLHSMVKKCFGTLALTAEETPQDLYAVVNDNQEKILKYVCLRLGVTIDSNYLLGAELTVHMKTMSFLDVIRIRNLLSTADDIVAANSEAALGLVGRALELCHTLLKTDPANQEAALSAKQCQTILDINTRPTLDEDHSCRKQLDAYNVYLKEPDKENNWIRICNHVVARMNQTQRDILLLTDVRYSNGHDSIVTLLLEGKANVDTPNNVGATPLFIATGKGHDSTVTLLLEGKANVDTPNNNGATPLLFAAQGGHDSTVTLLLEGKANVNNPNNKGATPLLFAAQEGHDSTVTLLLEGKANVDTPNNNGHTPLFLAAQKGHDSIVTLLRERKANVDTP